VLRVVSVVAHRCMAKIRPRDLRSPVSLLPAEVTRLSALICDGWLPHSLKCEASSRMRGQRRQAAQAVMRLSLRALPATQIVELLECHPATVRRDLGVP
jgi:hypothetical protein